MEEKKVENIFNEPSECAFHKKQGPVCSPTKVIEHMHDYLSDVKKISVEKSPEKIINHMKDAMNCNSESCILKRPEFIEFAKMTGVNSILNEFFKPEGPALTFGLLSNFNIDNVLKQLELKFKHFLHIPFQMRDFEKVGTELARVDLVDKFSNGKTCFGVVLNTDWSSGGGIHWYCLFGQKSKDSNGGDKIQLEYFNSSGKAPLPETQVWLNKTKHYLERQLKIPVAVHYSTGIQFQNDEHSCGVYCLMYIWLRLEGVSANWFKAENFHDAMMHRARKLVFRHEA